MVGMDDSKGFTLVELMVTVAVIGVLAAIAIPIYMNYVYRGKQVEAKNLLMTIKVEEEQFRAENNCYTTVITDGGGVDRLPETKTLNSNDKYFSVNPANLTGTASANCPAASSLADDFQAVVTGTLASGHAVDRWGVSDRIPAPVHCDGRAGLTADQVAACPGGNTTEMEY